MQDHPPGGPPPDRGSDHGFDRGSDPGAHDSRAPGAGGPGASQGSPGASGPEGSHAAPPPGEGAPPKKGLSGGAKFLIGCLGLGFVLVLLGGIGLVLLFNVGGNMITQRVGDFAGGVERQAEAQRTLTRLQHEHQFEQPSGGIVDDASARMVFAVTDDMWAVMQPWAEELADLTLRLEERETASITDLAAGLRGLSRFGEGRAIFAETLDAHGVSAEEYIWTGLALVRAHEELERPEASRAAPPENMALAQRYHEEIALLRRTGEENRPEKGAVFHLAVIWGMGDGSAWRAMGLDTMYVR